MHRLVSHHLASSQLSRIKLMDFPTPTYQAYCRISSVGQRLTNVEYFLRGVHVQE